MSNQIVISSGAKVRSLEGVLTGSAGIVNSVPLGGANGVATLDSNGKVPLSQLPASVVTYLGTWNAATNTPTLANGTGDVGDLYICNVAGTVNFGAGPITFAVGDWVIYNGSEWQKSAGQNGTVTSVAVTSTGNDAISITGSPITTAGTINIGFTGDNTQYINGAGDLTTFPSLTGYVPYTGATTDVDLGVHVLNAQALHVKGTAGAGHLGLKHQSAAATGSANESLIYANVAGDLAWQNDNLYLTTLSTHANTANRVYTFPDLTGTMAMLEGTQTFTGAKTFNTVTNFNQTVFAPFLSINSSSGILLDTDGSGNGGALKFTQNTSTSVGGPTQSSLSTSGNSKFYFYAGVSSGVYRGFYLDNSLLTTNAVRTYQVPDASGTLALTSDIPSLSGYVPYTGATTTLNLGTNPITTFGVNIYGDPASSTGGAINIRKYSSAWSLGTGDNLSLYANTGNQLVIQTGGKTAYLDFNSVSSTSPRTYTLPDATGTIALTSDIPSLANYVTLTGTQTITGVKTFSNEQLFSNGLTINGGYLTFADSGFSSTLDTTTLTASRAILLPNASGTLALTSDLSAYLPLTGGTLTGALNGTSATFSSSVTATEGIFSSGGVDGSLGAVVRISTTNTNGNARNWALVNTYESYGDLNFRISNAQGGNALTAGTTIMTLNRSGNIGIATVSPNIGGYGSNSRVLTIQGVSGSYGILELTSNSANADGSAIGRLDFGSDGQAAGYKAISSIASFLSGSTSTKFGADLRFYTRANNAASGDPTERMRITSTGNVGIGTSSVTDFGSSYTVLDVYNGTVGGYLLARSPNVTGQISVDNNTAMYVQTRTNHPIVFAPNNTERMRITSGGNVLVNTTTDDGYKFSVYGGGNYSMLINQSGGTAGYIPLNISHQAASGDNVFITFNTSAGEKGKIYYNRGLNVTAYSTTSDYRIKAEIEDFNAIDIINNLKPKKYRIRDAKNKHIGFIAHELQEYFPQAVGGIKDEVDEKGNPVYQNVDYSQLTALLTKAIQELKAEIDELKNK